MNHPYPQAYRLLQHLFLQDAFPLQKIMLIVPTVSYLSACELTPFVTALVLSACLVGKSDFFAGNSQGPSWSPFQRLGHTRCFRLAPRLVLAPDYTLLFIFKQFHVWIYIRALGGMQMEPSDTSHLIFLRISPPLPLLKCVQEPFQFETSLLIYPLPCSKEWPCSKDTWVSSHVFFAHKQQRKTPKFTVLH